MNVPDTKENRDQCLCPGCPSYPHECRGELLYCSRGSTSCDIRAQGCICPDCRVYSTYSLPWIYFCDKEPDEPSGVVMRKRRRNEDQAAYQAIRDIKVVASMGESIVRSMGSQKHLPFSLDDLHLVPAQIYKIPKNREDPVNTATVIGPAAKKPLTSSSPILISGLSYGAVSKNVKLIISQVAAQENILFNSGEGGVLPEELSAKDRMIVQYSTGRFGISEALLKQASGVEIRFSQGAYPGKGSFLPAAKMTREIAGIRGLQKGEDAYSPARHPDIRNPDDLKRKIDWLRSLTSGSPIGAKIGCGAIEQDIAVLVSAGVDFIALDGFGGGTGATNDYVREHVGIPLPVAVPRAARYLRKLGVKDKVSLICGGSLRNSGDFTKCLALGADAVYSGTAALIAINCEQYRICHTGLCPTGVTTQRPDLVARCDISKGISRLGNFIRVMTGEIADLSRIVGKENVHDLTCEDLVSFNRDLALITGCPWVGRSSERAP
ncbi:MAG: DUF2769 domain-containing protein [Methanoregulaceae archaeon]|nr:DUF2769 domain-containing protein [Methanoregulaceae archaeon]